MHPADAGPARWLAVLGTVAEVIASEAMERNLGELAEPYQQGVSGTLSTLATCLSVTGAGLVSLMGRRKSCAVTGAALVLAGAATERWAIFKAGFASAKDPKYTVKPQRERIAGANAGSLGSRWATDCSTSRCTRRTWPVTPC